MLITIVKFLHLMSLVVWIGGIIFFSFFGAPSIFKALEKPLAGDVVGDIFPKYWIIGYSCSVSALGTLIFLWKKGATGATVRMILLSIMMALTFYAGMGIGPKTRAIKAQMRTIEDATEKEQMRQRFLKTHRQSVMVNAAILAMGIVTIFVTAYHIRM